jgi:DMSO/TMAO reductase YedYZ molybdopterin-dependent catalytic subunit
MKNTSRDARKSRLPPGQHEVEELPVLQKGKVPQIERDKYELEITGEVKNERSFSLEELQELRDTELTADVHCVTSWSKFDTNWSGVSFNRIFDIVEPKESANFVEFLCHDGGFTTTVPIEELDTPNTMLALKYGGLPLGEKHGGPVRALIPDLYFYKSAKWVKKITFLEEDRLGYWERGGYSNKADPWKEQRYRSDDEK